MERARVDALRDSGILLLTEDRQLHAATRVASRALECPIALVSLVDDKRQRFIASVGLAAKETPREHAFCAHAIADDAHFVVPDAHQDPRFRNNPLVTGDPNIVAYAGRPLSLAPNVRVGTLCVIDKTRREFTESELSTLEDLGELVEARLRASSAARFDDEAQAQASTLPSVHDRRLAIALEASGVGIWEWDLRSNRLIWDPRMYQLYGLDPAATADLYPMWAEALHDEDRARAEAEVQDALADRKKLDTAFRIRSPRGGVHHIRALADVLCNGRGEPERMIGVNWDISEDMERERIAQAQARDLRAFSHVVAHELRAPLRHVRAFAKMLREDYGSHIPEDGQGMLSALIGAAGTLNEMVVGLLEYAHNRSAALHIEACDLTEMVEGLRPLLGDTDSQFVLEVQPPLGTVHVAPALFCHVLRNLIENAIKYQPPGQTPVVKLWRTSTTGVARIHVKDNGLGFDPGLSELAFTMFRRLHPGSKKSGTGMGLALCRQIVERHGGTISVETAPGEGAHFTVTIPDVPTRRDEQKGRAPEDDPAA